jgi:hypothetical protein
MTREVSAEPLNLKVGNDRLRDSSPTRCVCRAAPSTPSFLFYFLGQNHDAALYRHLPKQRAMQDAFIHRALQSFDSTLLIGAASLQSVASELTKFTEELLVSHILTVDD